MYVESADDSLDEITSESGKSHNVKVSVTVNTFSRIE